jgi:hypothetical protein
MYRPADIKYVKGRVVESVNISSDGAAILFNDETYLVFKITDYNNGAELECNTDLDLYEMRRFGIVSEEEYDILHGIRDKEIKANREAYELKLFNELKLKYGETK